MDNIHSQDSDVVLETRPHVEPTRAEIAAAEIGLHEDVETEIEPDIDVPEDADADVESEEEHDWEDEDPSIEDAPIIQSIVRYNARWAPEYKFLLFTGSVAFLATWLLPLYRATFLDILSFWLGTPGYAPLR